MNILVTGAAGFIGSHVCRSLIARGDFVIGIDNLNPYYDVQLKKARLKELSVDVTDNSYPATSSNFKFFEVDVADASFIGKICREEKITHIIHLAAQAGVRYSIDHPFEYSHSNLQGFLSVLEAARSCKIDHLIYASSSSVYGLNKKMPFEESNTAAHPISLYGATKRANELMAHSYSHLYQIPTSALRFFTVYGPYGRPDMAYYKFADAIMNDRPIDVYNEGKMYRDFTYIDDIVASIIKLIDHPPKSNAGWNAEKTDPSTSSAPFAVYNIGNENPVLLSDMISYLEDFLGKKAIKNYLPMQPGDVLSTHADVSRLETVTGFKPKVSLKEGLKEFSSWFLNYHGYA